MKGMNKVKLFGLASTLVLGAFMSTSSLAVTPGGDGACDVRQERAGNAVFFVPRGGSGDYNILGWGNGTGAPVVSYSGMLEAAASQCVVVAAATTSQSGSGREVANAISQAKRRYSDIVASEPKVCTSGHSQGGGGSFNAANRADADCVIAVQPDTVATTQIRQPVDSDVDVVCIFSRGDVLAPAQPVNGRNCRRNSTNYTQEMTSGTHFAPIGGSGGEPGEVLVEYVNRWLVE